MRASCISAVDYYVRGQPQPLELLTVVDGKTASVLWLRDTWLIRIELCVDCSWCGPKIPNGSQNKIWGDLVEDGGHWSTRGWCDAFFPGTWRQKACRMTLLVVFTVLLSVWIPSKASQAAKWLQVRTTSARCDAMRCAWVHGDSC